MTTALWAAPAGAALVFLLLRTTLLAATVNGPSMLPTLAAGDRILVLRRWITRRPRRDDVVVVNMPLPARGGGVRRQLNVKRVAGVAGDRSTFDEQELTLGARQLFVVGDNAEHSFDSRDVGPLALDDVVGRMICRLSRTRDVAAS